MSQQELADWAGTSPDAVGRFLRSWRDRGIIARGERSRRLTIIDLDGLAALCDVAPPETRADRALNGSQFAAAQSATLPRQQAQPPSKHGHPSKHSLSKHSGSRTGASR